MDKLITAFTNNIEDAFRIAKNSPIQDKTNEIRNVVICGMGGSGIGGKIVSQWIQSEIQVPVLISQDYTLPIFVNEHTLVIGVSYSGNTEETLSALAIAQSKNAQIKCIASGGKLESFCKSYNYDVIIVPSGNQPRAAIAYPLVQLLHILKELDLISDKCLQDLNQAKISIDKDLELNKSEAKKIANFLFNKTFIVYSEPSYEGVAVRAVQQLNENSKMLGWHSVIPEMNHNELVGWKCGNDAFAVLFLRTSDANPKNSKRMDLTKEIISKKTPYILELNAKGDSIVERSINLINILDWTSFYLVELNNVDAFDIDVLNHLKKSMADF